MEYVLICLSADVFSQHLDMELSEEDVQIIMSDSKAKTQITVPPSLFVITYICLIVYLTLVTAFKFSGQNWELYLLQNLWINMDPLALRKTPISLLFINFWRHDGRP